MRVFEQGRPTNARPKRGARGWPKHRGANRRVQRTPAAARPVGSAWRHAIESACSLAVAANLLRELCRKRPQVSTITNLWATSTEWLYRAMMQDAKLRSYSPEPASPATWPKLECEVAGLAGSGE